MVTNDLQFITPFSTFGDDEISSDPLAQEVVRYNEGGFPYNGTVELYNIPKPDIQR